MADEIIKQRSGTAKAALKTPPHLHTQGTQITRHRFPFLSGFAAKHGGVYGKINITCDVSLSSPDAAPRRSRTTKGSLTTIQRFASDAHSRSLTSDHNRRALMASRRREHFQNEQKQGTHVAIRPRGHNVRSVYGAFSLTPPPHLALAEERSSSA